MDDLLGIAIDSLSEAEKVQEKVIERKKFWKMLKDWKWKYCIAYSEMGCGTYITSLAEQKNAGDKPQKDSTLHYPFLNTTLPVYYKKPRFWERLLTSQTGTLFFNPEEAEREWWSKVLRCAATMGIGPPFKNTEPPRKAAQPFREDEIDANPSLALPILNLRCEYTVIRHLDSRCTQLYFRKPVPWHMYAKWIRVFQEAGWLVKGWAEEALETKVAYLPIPISIKT